MDRMQRFVNLLSVATADGRLTEREVRFLSQRARDWGLSDHQFAIAVNRSLEHPGKLQIPRRRAERAELLRDMLRIMASDGSLLDVEKQLFATVAAHMKFTAAEIDAIIDELVGNEARGETPVEPPPASNPVSAPRLKKPRAAKPAPLVKPHTKPPTKAKTTGKTTAKTKAKTTAQAKTQAKKRPSLPPPKSPPKSPPKKPSSKQAQGR